MHRWSAFCTSHNLEAPFNPFINIFHALKVHHYSSGEPLRLLRSVWQSLQFTSNLPDKWPQPCISCSPLLLLRLHLKAMPLRKQEQRKGEVSLSLPNVEGAQGPFFLTHWHGHSSLCQGKTPILVSSCCRVSGTWPVGMWVSTLTFLIGFHGGYGKGWMMTDAPELRISAPLLFQVYCSP